MIFEQIRRGFSEDKGLSQNLTKYRTNCFCESIIIFFFTCKLSEFMMNE